MRRWLSGILLAVAVAAFALPVVALFLAALLPEEAAASFIGGGGFALSELAHASLRQVRAALADGQFQLKFANSARIALASLALGAPASLCAGVLLARARMKGMRALYALYVLALLLPFQVIMLPAYQLSLWTGTYDSHLSVAALAALSPLGPLAMAALISGIPDAQWRAASLETASVMRVLWRVVLPQILPGAAALALVMFSEAWNMVEQPLVLLSATSNRQPLSLALNDIVVGNASYGLAGAALYALPAVAAYALCAAFLARRLWKADARRA